LSEKDEILYPKEEEAKPIIIKGAPPSSQAERLVRIRREITHTEELTRLERMEIEARQKAEAIVAEAQAKAEELIAKARSDAERIRKDAQEQGASAAKKEALERLAALFSSLENEINSLRNIRASFLKHNLEGIVEFSCALSQRILVAEMRLRPDLIAERVLALLERLPPKGKVTLAVSPTDLDTITRFIHDSGNPTNNITPFLISDPSLPSGSIRLESDSGRIDAGFMDTLESMGKLLIEQARHQASMMDNPGGTNA